MSGAAGQTTAPTLVAPPTQDKWQAAMKDMQNTAAFGVNIDKMITAKSKGQHDEWRGLKLQVRREFFTTHQVMVSMFWALIAGVFIGTIVMALMNHIMIDVKGQFMWINLSIFLLSYGIAEMVSGTQAYSGLKKCTTATHKAVVNGVATETKVPIVDRKYQGQECFDDWECTDNVRLEHGQRGMCKHGGTLRPISTWIGRVVTIAGVALTAYNFSTTTERPPKQDMFQAAVYGIFAGTAQAIIIA